jgi:hypothetical protein
MASTTTTTTSGYAPQFQDQASSMLEELQGLYDTGQLGQVAGFNQTQLGAQQAGIGAAGVQTGLEGQLAGMAGQTDLSGMRTAAQQQALSSLNLNASNAGRYGGLGGSRQMLNNQSIANDLAAKFGQIDMQKQQMDVANTQAALNAQGTGAASMAAVGLGQQQQQQNVLDAPYKGVSQLGEMFSAMAGKQTTATEKKGGK